MATQNENINLIVSAANKTQGEFKKIVGDLDKVETKTGKVINAQKKFGRVTKQAASEARTALTGLSASLGGVASVLGKIGPVGWAAAVSIGAYATATYKGTKAAAEWDKRMARTAALLRATGGAAGLSAKELEEFAKQRDLATLGDKDGIMDAMNVLQTFKSVSGDTFTETIKVAQDLAVVLGTDLRSTTVQLGKALEDPVAGLTALRRVGVSFTDAEKEMIKTMLDANDMAGAQAKILGVLRKQVGGAADAEAEGLLGSIDTLSYEWREFLESLEQTDAAVSGVQTLIDIIRELREITDPSIDVQIRRAEQERDDAWMYELDPDMEAHNRNIALLKGQKATEANYKAWPRFDEEGRTASMRKAEEDAEKARADAAKKAKDAWDETLKAAKEVGAAIQKQFTDDSVLRSIKGGLSDADLATYRFKAEEAGTEDAAAFTEEVNKSVEAMRLLKDVDGAFVSEIRVQHVEALEELRQAEEERLRASRDASDGAKRALKDYSDAATNAAASMEGLFGDAAQATEDALVDAFTTGKFSAQDMINTIVADLARMGVQQAVTGPLFSGLFSMFHDGGVVGGAARVRFAPPDIFAGAPRFHSGGLPGLLAGEIPIIAKKGEEVLTERDRRTVGAALDGSGGAQVTVNVTNNAGADVGVEQSSNGAGGVNLDIIIDKKVAGAITRSGSATSKALAGMGLRQPVVRR